MKRAGGLLQELATRDPLVRVIDTSATLLGAEGKPDPALLREDGLHMNAEGNAKWVAVIKPVLEEALKK
jgi:lysophospholipase L1-like esterase